MCAATMSSIIPNTYSRHSHILFSFDQRQQKNEFQARVSLPITDQRWESNNIFIWYRVFSYKQTAAVDLNIGCLIKAPRESCITEYQLLDLRWGGKKDKRTHPHIAKLVRLPYWPFAENEQITSRASWSVSAVWIPIGNHSPTCFLEDFTHQKQRLCHPVTDRSRGLFLVVWTHSTTKRVKMLQEGTDILQLFGRYTRTVSVKSLARTVYILMVWLHELRALLNA